MDTGIGVWPFGRTVRVIVACLVAGGLTAGCGTSGPSDVSRTQAPSQASTRTANATSCIVATSWYAEAGRLDWEVPTLEREIPAAGLQYMEDDAKADQQAQADQIDRFVGAGAKVIIIEPGVEEAYLPAVQRAIKAGVAVISLWSPTYPATTLHATLYVAFDPVEQGRQEAKALLALKPKGAYAIVKGNSSTSLESRLIAAGVQEVLQPAVDRGDVRIVASVDTPGWDPEAAKAEMATILSQNGGRVDAVAVESEGMAAGVGEALEAAGLKGEVAVASGGSFNSWEGLMNVLKGTQTVEVWGNLERTAHAAAQAAIALCHDPDIAKVAGSASVTWPDSDPMRAILLAPVPITKDNIATVIQTDMQWRQQICGDGPFYGPDVLPACKLGPQPASSASASAQP